MIPKGIHPGLGMPEYHAWKLDRTKLIEGPISASMLKRFAPNPFEWLHTPEQKQSAAMRTGSLFDAALTDPKELDGLLPLPSGDFTDVVISPFDSFRSGEARKWRDAQLADGKRPMKSEELEEMTASFQADMEAIIDQRNNALIAAECVRKHEIAGDILQGAQFQVGVIGDIGGIPAKCLLDILPREDSDWGETLVDYKTTGMGIDDDSIRKAFGKYKYHWQAAFYRTLFNKVCPDRHCEDFAFIFQSTSTMEVRVVRLASDALILGTRSVKDAVEEFIRCAHKGIGSRYTKGCAELDLMPYHAMCEDEYLSRKEEVGA